MTPDLDPSSHPPTARGYSIALTFSVLLFLATLTAVLVLIVIGDARADERQQEFDVTLTAAFAEIRQTQAILPVAPTPAPTLLAGQYAFELAAPFRYSAGSRCTEQGLAGIVLDGDGQPLDGFHVHLWGDYTPSTVVFTGEVGGYATGEWRAVLDGALNRRVWVQLFAGDRTVSAPVEVVFDQAVCEQSLVELAFQQVAEFN